MKPLHLSNARLDLGLCPALGGAITGFRWHHPAGGKIDLMRPMSVAADGPDDIEAASAFPLTPFSNRVRDGKFSFRGSDIAMPRNTAGPHVEHGHGWQRPWHVVRANATQATLRYHHHADTWPYPYEMEQRFQLSDDRLMIELLTRNCGDRPMPYGFGLHPYFPRTPDCTLRANVSGYWQRDADVMPTRLAKIPRFFDPGGGLRVDDHDLDTVFVGWDGAAEIRWPERQAGLAMDTDGPLNFLVLYTPPGQDYFCAEPVSNCTDAFNLAAAGRTDTGMLVIEPGAQVRARISFTPHVI